MKVTRKFIFVALLLALWLPAAMHAAPAMLKAKIDSTTIFMGKTATINLELVLDKGQQGFWPCDQADTLNAMVEIAGRGQADTVDLGNNRVQINRDLIVQSFDSGQWHIDPIIFVSGTDTIKSGPLVLNVLPIKVDPNGGIRDFAPVEEPERHWLDWVPDWIAGLWWLWLLLILLAVALWVYFKWIRKGKNPLSVVKRRVPPYEEAMQRLQALKAQQLWQSGQDKAYYTALTDILREYIDRRFSINAVEMTSSQIIRSLKDNQETRVVNDQLAEILAIADFVKFAGQRPLADDNEMSFQRALNFVEQTRPVAADAAKNNNDSKEEKA